MSKSKKIEMANPIALEGLMTAFVVATEPNNHEKSKVDFCKALMAAFLVEGVEFIYTFDVNKPKFSVNAVKKQGQPRVTIVYEAGLCFFPRCFWFDDGTLHDTTFLPDQLFLSEESISHTIKQWKGFCAE